MLRVRVPEGTTAAEFIGMRTPLYENQRTLEFLEEALESIQTASWASAEIRAELLAAREQCLESEAHFQREAVAQLVARRN